MELKAKQTLRDTLKAAHAAGQGVTLHLRSGLTLAGRVAEVAEHQVVLAELSGREFHDALVLIEDISVIEVRAR